MADVIDPNRMFKALVSVLLIFITFFLGSMWLQLASGCPLGYGKKMMCPWEKKMDGHKMCPITGKPLSSSPVEAQ